MVQADGRQAAKPVVPGRRSGVRQQMRPRTGSQGHPDAGTPLNVSATCGVQAHGRQVRRPTRFGHSPSVPVSTRTNVRPRTRRQSVQSGGSVRDGLFSSRCAAVKSGPRAVPVSLVRVRLLSLVVALTIALMAASWLLAQTLGFRRDHSPAGMPALINETESRFRSVTLDLARPPRLSHDRHLPASWNLP